MISINTNNVVHNLAGWSWWQCLSCASMCSHLMSLFLESVGNRFFQAISFPFPTTSCQAALTMQGMTFHAQNQIFKRLEPTVTDHPVYLLTEGCDWFCGSKLLSNWSCLRKVTDSLGIRTASVHDAQFSHNNLTVFDAKLGWHTSTPNAAINPWCPTGVFPENPEASRVPQRIGPQCWQPSAPAKDRHWKGWLARYIVFARMSSSDIFMVQYL